MRARGQSGHPTRSSARLFDPATLARLYRARDYLAASYKRPTFLEDAAREAALSPYYFNRLFTSVFNETPHEFLTRLRMDEAKRLLGAGNQSVTEICLEVGYESVGSFSTRFRDLTTLSPTAFRREAHRVFGGFGKWPWFYVPGCFRYYKPG
jgi:AraC-like DNA-binding protein